MSISCLHERRWRLGRLVIVAAFALIGTWPAPTFGQIVWDGGTGSWFGPWLGSLPGVPNAFPPPYTNWLCEFCYPGAGDAVNIGNLFGPPIGAVSGIAILNSSTTVAVISLGNGAFGGLDVLSGGTLTATIGITIGTTAPGSGALTISGGVVNTGFAWLGVVSGTSGNATVSGAGSQLNVSGSDEFLVGLQGQGTLSISNGGVVTSSNSVIAELAGSSGQATVMGQGSQWNNSSGFLTVGSGGQGALIVSVGGAVSAMGIDVGFGSLGTLVVESGGVLNTSSTGFGNVVGYGGAGAATIEGVGSRWNNAGFLDVGDGSKGSLNIQSGGVVIVGANTTLGYFGGSGNITVSGPGSQLVTSGDVDVGLQTSGESGQGTLVVQNGGVASSAGGLIGTNAGGVGSVTVTGAGSQWNSSGGLTVGNGGQGTLLVQSGGVLNTGSTGYGVIGLGGAGTATIDGAGSRWNNAGELDVGQSSQGILNIQSGGVATVGTNAYVGYYSGNGIIAVSGPGSQLAISDGIYIGLGVSGESGQGTMTVENAGVTTDAIGLIGTNANGAGSVTVTGVGSQWNSNSLTIGNGGQGTLTISDGGEVNDVTAKVGASSGSTGSVLVDAGEFTTSGTLSIGIGGGTGTVTVTNDGQLTAAAIVVGSGGSLIVDPAIVETGDFTLSPGGVLSLDIAGSTPGLFSMLDISGTGTFQGTVDLDFIGGFAPTVGESFDLINAIGGADFAGATFQIEGLEPGFQYTDTFSAGQFTLEAENNGVSSATPEPNLAWLMGCILIVLSVGVLRNKVG